MDWIKASPPGSFSRSHGRRFQNAGSGAVSHPCSQAWALNPSGRPDSSTICFTRSISSCGGAASRGLAMLHFDLAERWLQAPYSAPCAVRFVELHLLGAASSIAVSKTTNSCGTISTPYVLHQTLPSMVASQKIVRGSMSCLRNMYPNS